MDQPGHASRSYPHDALVIAPDGSRIHELAETPRGSCVHCTLYPGSVSAPIRHRTVDEVWYVLDGQGEIWRARETGEETTALVPGTCLTVAVGTAFQFRNTGIRDLRILITTMPPWPGAEEAEAVEGRWEPSPGPRE